MRITLKSECLHFSKENTKNPKIRPIFKTINQHWKSTKRIYLFDVPPSSSPVCHNFSHLRHPEKVKINSFVLFTLCRVSATCFGKTNPLTKLKFNLRCTSTFEKAENGSNSIKRSQKVWLEVSRSSALKRGDWGFVLAFSPFCDEHTTSRSTKRWKISGNVLCKGKQTR